MTGTIEWGCNWYEQGMELIDEHLFWGMLTMTIGESLGYPHPIPTISTPSRVPSFHHGASGRSWHRPWRHRRTADSCPATAAWAPARSKMGTAQMVRRLARIKRMWHVIRWNPPNQWCHPSLDLGRTASISPFNLTEICRHWANHWKYWKLDVDIIIWDFQKKNSHPWIPILGRQWWDIKI
jgi:hypothetical protein